jgi:hypothetical protein
LSFVPGLNAKECEEVLAALVDHQGLTGEQAVTVIWDVAGVIMGMGCTGWGFDQVFRWK